MATYSKLSPLWWEDNLHPCKHVRQAAIRSHLDCVKHFWDLRDESDLPEDQLFKEAVWWALRNRDTGILEFLLSIHCPCDRERARVLFDVSRFDFGMYRWADWRDIYQIAFKYKIPPPEPAIFLLERAMGCGDWDFLKKALEYGYDIQKVADIHFADQPNVAAIKAFLAQDAFSTINFTWLTPDFAEERDDPALLEFACELRATQEAHHVADILPDLGI